MQKKEVYILTGTIHSGKSSTLGKWCQTRNDVFGILSPVENGKRFFQDISSGEKFPMEATSDEISTIPIGKFKFSMNAFSKAVEVLSGSSYNKKGWLVIDEIGPLELSGRGFDEVLKEILQASASNMKIILVVRDTLKEDVIQRYSLNDHLIKEVNFLSGQDALV
ncbi:MAG: nucleoside-triphosphatase [Bacteroidota bacterium]